MALPVDILIVIATVVTAFAFASVVSAWADRRFPSVALFSLAVGVGLFAYVHWVTPEGLGMLSIPDAFILVAARILN